ncbi:MAG: asparaginase [Alphaproteobacteria bacterium]
MAAADKTAAPILVETTRGKMVESRHRGIAAVVDASGKVVLSWGDVETPVYARSAIKALQALPLIESGAADAFSLGDEELAMACASHGGEPIHVQTITAWLNSIGLSVDDLECGTHPPRYRPAAQALQAAGIKPSAVHNVCSGKHTAMLATARHLGEPIKGYAQFQHPVQQRILGLLEMMCGLDLSSAPCGIDGCSIPTIAIPLGNIALGMAKLADPTELPTARAAAASRICKAIAAAPHMIAGTGRFCTEVMQVTGSDAIIKTGAEGVFCGALPALGLGIALKIDDGATRASEVAMASILQRLGILDQARSARLANRLKVPLRNCNGIHVGDIRPTQAIASL